MGSILNNVDRSLDPNRGSGEGRHEITDAVTELASHGGGMLLLVVPPTDERGYTVHPFTATMTLNGVASKEAVGHVMEQITAIVIDRMFPEIEPNESVEQSAEDGGPTEDGEPSV
jgi:hypothetical protein